MVDNNIVVGLNDREAEAVLESAQQVVQVVAKGVRQAGLKESSAVWLIFQLHVHALNKCVGEHIWSI